jgi:RNA polymerase sigma-32 factor
VPRKKKTEHPAPDSSETPKDDETPDSDGGSRAESDNGEDEGVDAVAGELVDADEPIGGDVELADEPIESSPVSLARLDAMAAYLREIQKHPLLSPEETRALAIRFQETQDPAAAAKLVTSNLRLVVKIAYEYRRAYKNMMDLIQEGNIGLMQAVKRYDPYRGVKLSSYGAWWIRAYMLRYILNNWRLVKLGTTQAQRKLFFNLKKKKAELESMGIDPSHAELAKRLDVSESDVAEMDVRLSSNENSLDAPVGDADGRAISRVDTMPSASAGPESLMADEELQSMLKDKLGTFRETLSGKEKEIEIFDKRLVAEDPLTLQELGEQFGISRERVRQLEQRLTLRLRDYLKREMGDATEVS